MYQATIGPRSFREGLLSFQWRVAQQRYYVNEASKEKSKQWVSKLFQKLWEVSWGMWEFQNNNIHTNAETRRDWIFKEIDTVKLRAKFSMLLTPKERRFINTPIMDLKRKSERGQLDWICRAEQFVCIIHLSKRLRQSTGQYFDLHARTLTSDVQQSIRRYTTSTTTEQEREQRITQVSNSMNSSDNDSNKRTEKQNEEESIIK